MSFPSMVHKSGDALVVRSLVSGNQLYPATSITSNSISERIDQIPMSLKEEKSTVMVSTPGTIPPTANTKNLPQCRVRRTYTCVHCKLLTQNPRDHLYHLRDVHKERVRIFECTDCIYASKQFQKLVRHKKMVHGTLEFYDSANTASRSLRRTMPASLPQNTNYQENSENCSEFEDRFLVNIESFNDANVTEEQIFTKCTMNSSQRKIKENPSEDFQCKLCSFKTNSKYLLLNHEKEDHVKTNFFRCEKCSYLTHIKARFTKHVKYHTMPMIKCDMCDFKTPYKWNLDRHSKNHNGNGTFKCAICNFTADIKQSLTVHEMNHHVPPVGSFGVGINRKRNKVGGSDNCNADEILIDSVADLDYDMFDEQMPGVLIHDKRKSQKDCTTTKKFRIDDSGLSEESDEPLQYVQNKCQFCEYKTAWNTEMVQHETTIHNFNRNKNNNLNDKNKKKVIKPLPNLIPINFDRNNHKEIRSSRSTITEFEDNDNNNDNDDSVEMENITNKFFPKNNIIPQNSQLSKISNSSFFAKVKERLLTGGDKDSLICQKCGYMATCLTDIESHQKMCQEDEMNEMIRNENKISELSITATRCPYCRLRCKTSVELQNHLTTCSVIDVNESDPEPEQSSHEVFEDSNLNEKSNVFNSNLTEEIEIQPEIEIMAFDYDESDGEEHESEIDNESGNDDKLDRRTIINNIRNDYKQMFKCPYCDFKSSIVSQFHVHFINHSDRKPYECSICDYQSVWSWDIRKHIKIKQSKDQSHDEAVAVTIDETGRRNYSKYNQYLVRVENDSNDNSNSCNESDEQQQQQQQQPNDFELTNSNSNDNSDGLPSLMSESNLISIESNNHRQKTPPPNTNRLSNSTNLNESFNADLLNSTQRFFKCKRCGFTNSSRENMITHIQIMHNKNSTIQQVSILNNDVDELGFAKERGQFRCAHCNQISNWKHVIQRHCRLKHNGDIKVIIINKFGVEKLETEDTGDDNNTTNEQLNGNLQEGSFKCSHCEFSCDSFMEFELHFNQHPISKTPNDNQTFKCVYCEVVFDDQFDLHEHLIQNHGTNTDVTTNLVTSSKDHCYECHLCYYNTDVKQDFFNHFQTCHADNCQEDLVVDDDNDNNDDEEETQVNELDTVLVRQNSNISTNLTLNIDDQSDNKVHDLDTKHFTDIPLVWVSRMGNFVKMYKCRYCPHVNFRKININDHEKMHRYRETDPAKPNDILHYCTDCSYVCNNAGVLSSHSKVHRGFFGVIHCLVDFSKSDQEQINELMDAIQSTNSNQKTKSNDLCFDLKLIAYEFTGDNFPKNSGDNNSSLLVTNYNASNNNNNEVIDTNNQLLSFCNQCPARFLSEEDIINHKRFHSLKLIHRCICCSYTAKQKPHILAHDKIHMKEYQTKTNILLRTFRINEKFMPPKLITVMKESDNVSRLLWVVNSADLFKLQTKSNTTKMSQCYSCSKCPAKFFKEDALNYHSNLHGKNSPYKCSSCDYAAKNVVSLERHQCLHRNQSIQITNKSINMVPLSGTDVTDGKINLEKSQHEDTQQVQHFDPQFGTLINGNPNFIYPTCLKKGKLKEKRYKCHKCPSAFEKREQYRVHLTLHGSKQKYTCDYCDYSVKYYANFTQHIKKHEMHNEALAIKQMEIDQSQNIQNYLNPEELLDQQDQEVEEHERLNSDVDNNNTVKQIEHISQNSSFFEIKKLHTCQFCPYSNYRKDAVDSHLKRHISVSGVRHVHVCNYCDYTVPQAHFLREHERLHLNMLNNKVVNIQTDDEKVDDISNRNDNNRYVCSEIEEKIFEKFAEKKDDGSINYECIQSETQQTI